MTVLDKISSTILGQPHRLPCPDGEWVAATLFQRPVVPADAPTLVINPAIGAIQSRYVATARWWAAKGWRVVTYDYRGMGITGLGQSSPERFRLWDWGAQDLTAVLGWVRQALAPRALVVLGHSIGAQIIQFSSEIAHVDAAVFVAGQKGYWRYWRNRYRYPLVAFWYAILPACVGLCGDFRLMRLGGCDPLPAKVALDWARWSRNVPFTADVPSHAEQLRCPVLSISLEDDPLFGPVDAVEALLPWYGNAAAERLHLVPREHGVTEIGHSGLFRRRHLDRFWPMVEAWLETHLAMDDGL